MDNFSNNLNVNLLNVKVPVAAFHHNREVLQTFAKRTAENFLGIINVSGNKISRVNNVAWAAQWTVRQDLEPIVTTLAGTFNFLLADCKEEVDAFHANLMNESHANLMNESHANLTNESFSSALEHVAAAKAMLSEIEVIKDSYVYRYGDVPDGDRRNLDRAINNILPWAYRRTPEKQYKEQNAAVTKLQDFCGEQRRELNEIVEQMNRAIKMQIKNNPLGAAQIFEVDPSLLKDKVFLKNILEDNEVNGLAKFEIKKLITDPEMIASLQTVSLPSGGIVVSEEVRAKANARNNELLKTRTGTTLTTDDAIKIQNITKGGRDLDSKHD